MVRGVGGWCIVGAGSALPCAGSWAGGGIWVASWRLGCRWWVPAWVSMGGGHGGAVGHCRGCGGIGTGAGGEAWGMMGVGGIGAGVHAWGGSGGACGAASGVRARGRGRVGVGQGLGEDSPCGLGARWSLVVFTQKLSCVCAMLFVLSQIGNFLGTIKHAY